MKDDIKIEPLSDKEYHQMMKYRAKYDYFPDSIAVYSDELVEVPGTGVILTCRSWKNKQDLPGRVRKPREPHGCKRCGGDCKPHKHHGGRHR
jgi:hypothetical protein